MRFFLLNTLADHGRGEYCFMSEEPQGVGPSTYRLARGEPLRGKMTEATVLTWSFGKDYPGLKLSSFLGNTGRYLAVHRNVAEIVQRHRAGELEVIPFVLHDHRARPRSEDYVFLNPLGSTDCLDTTRSVIKRARSGNVIDVPKMVLERGKLAGAPGLFRVREIPSRYVFSGALVDEIAAQRFTNFVFNEIELV
ncbi:hypothetical protein WME90_26200 [Sorangium sp. So ce375]|uniref:imm11 family protein n=1 Tax=Sorangium sp. So ce375 TaxID=3133306 RepID=UPI003F5BC063